MILARAIIAALALLLAACQQPAEPSPPAEAPVASTRPIPPAAPVAPMGGDAGVRLQPTGLTVSNASGGAEMLIQLPFGMAQAAVIEMLTTLRDRPPTQRRNEECGAGPLDFADWGDGLSFVFQDGRFVGWWADDQAPAGYATEPGVHVGSTLAQVRAAYPAVEVRTSTIGPELIAGDLFGTLSGTEDNARVTALWAGTSCIFR